MKLMIWKVQKYAYSIPYALALDIDIFAENAHIQVIHAL